MLFKCECGVQIDCKPPLYCRCGRVLGLDERKHYQPTVCKHRGDRKGTASCKCGVIYECDLLGGVCSDRAPKFELYTITLNLDDGTSCQLSDVEYRPCQGCNRFAKAASV